jgi:hypothetical protein
MITWPSRGGGVNGGGGGAGPLVNEFPSGL